MWSGKLLHIHTTARTGTRMAARQSANAVAGVGLEGDRYSTGKGKYSRAQTSREVTLFEIEAIRAVQEEHGVSLDPGDHRRNLTTEGVPLGRLVGEVFSVGETVLEGQRFCGACRYLNVMARKPISSFLNGRSGLICRVVEGGSINIGDTIQPINPKAGGAKV